MKQLIILLTCSFILSCKANKVSTSPACKAYFSFVKANWKYDEAKSLYYFVGNPEYWDKEKHNKNKFLNSECLIGMGKEEVIGIFGTPTRAIDFDNLTGMLVYCLSENCRDAEYTAGKSIVLNLDEKKKVAFAYITPTDKKRSH